MNTEKAAYFDSQVDSEWASREYSDDELQRIDRMLRLAQWTPDMRILEPGCGTGRLTEILGDRCGNTGFILAADISEHMTRAARARLGRRRNVKVECEALENLPLVDEEFDLVVCHQVFPHFEDKEKALGILSTVLKPLGKLVLFHFMSSSEINDMHRKTDPSVMADSLPERETMRLMIHAAGFTIDLLEDDERGYLLIATRGRSTE
ncbi:MAG: methyltransferase domain-containing protein [Desulfomonilaceae bacterium]|nr:methyltransferase domain-containing protein [Desulfomonilaceae bacterium]